MKRGLLLFFSAVFCIPAFTQRKNFTYNFYGFVRADLFYDTRNNETTVSDNFYLFPKNTVYDADGKDLNAKPSGSFYTFCTRLGLDVTGPRIWGAETSAKIETDFGGFSSSTTMLRIRQAYINLAWSHSSLLIGQTWHPLFGEVSPTVLNLSTGAPFQPFNRSPQLRYRYNHTYFTATASAMIPELFAGIDFHKNKFLAGVGVEMISLKPRTEATVTQNVGGEEVSKTFKVNERITTTSFVAQIKYTESKYRLAAKTVYGKNLCHSCQRRQRSLRECSGCRPDGMRCRAFCIRSPSLESRYRTELYNGLLWRYKYVDRKGRQYACRYQLANLGSGYLLFLSGSTHDIPRLLFRETGYVV